MKNFFRRRVARPKLQVLTETQSSLLGVFTRTVDSLKQNNDELMDYKAELANRELLIRQEKGQVTDMMEHNAIVIENISKLIAK